MTSGRKDCRGGAHVCEPKSPREALYCQGHHAQMTKTEIAEAMGVNPSTLNNWLDPEHDSHIPDDRLEQLLRLTDDHSPFVRHLASVQGLVVYDPDTAKEKGRAARLVAEFGDLLKAIDAREDGTTLEEALRIEKEGNELITAVAAEIAAAKLAAEQGGGR